MVTQGGGLRAYAGGEGCPSVNLAFDHRVDVAFHGGGATGQGQPGSNGLLVAHSRMQIITFCMRHAGGRRFEPGEPNGGSGTQVARHQVTERDGRDGSASLLSSQAMPSFRLGEAAGQFTDVTGADQLADGRVTGAAAWPGNRRWRGRARSVTASAQRRIAGYALRVDGEFVAAGRRGTAGSGASPSLVFSCPGRVVYGAPARSQIPALGRDRSCRWPCRAVGGRASGAAAGPPVSEPARPGEPGPAAAGLSGSRTARAVPARPARQASPLGWWSRSWYRPVATAASSCHSRPRA
jgi:hypothetical protein